MVHKVIFKDMEIIKVTSREFRDNQKSFFELAESGKRIIITRGKKTAFTITPIEDKDLYFTPEMLETIDRSLQEVAEGKVVVLTEELKHELFGNL